MKVFISFSGEKSKRMADALTELLPAILPSVTVFRADTDIAIGERWQQSLERILDDLDLAIICVSHDNVEKPWLIYESGQLSRKGLIGITYLLDIEPAELSGPLAQFQAITADKGGTWRLITILNKEDDHGLPNEELSRVFGQWWPQMQSRIESARSTAVIGDVIGAVIGGDANVIHFAAHGSYGGPLDASKAPDPLQSQLSSNQAFDRIDAAVRQNLEQLRENFEQARLESRQFFRLTLLFASIGFFVVIAAVGFLLAGQAAAGIVASISSLIPEATAALFFRKDAELRKTIESYHQHILQSQQVLTMIDVGQTIEDPVERDRMKEQIIFKVLDIDAPIPSSGA
ncbi:MAG: toll/interleukin-1 receptor domain-containing protein [bacterium]|nr:toll/interleukin-1 receptor domain-containing protein [bacterium]